MNALTFRASGCARPSDSPKSVAALSRRPHLLRQTALLASLSVCPWLPVLSAQTASEPAAPAAPAADHGETDNEVLELPMFTITAQKVARPIQEVPMAVTALNTEKLASFNLFSVQDVQNVSPGLNVNMSDARNPIPSMRGITFNPDSGTTAAVDVYWNETAVSASTAFRAMYDVGQIEVLRGPQGTLRGRSSPGGAITIASRKPDLENFGASLQQSLSDQSLVNTQLALNAPIVKGKLGLRLAGLYDGNEAGGIHNITRNDDSGSLTRSGRATLEWKPSENFDLTLVHQVLKQRLVPYHPVQGSPIYSATMPHDVSPFDRISVNPGPTEYLDAPVISSLTAQWNLPGKHELVAVVGLQKTKTDTNVEFENMLNIIPGWGYPQQLDIDGKNHTYELRFSSVNHEKWNYIFGAYYENGNSTVGIKQAAIKLWFDGLNPFVSSSPVPRAPDMVVPLDMTVTSDGSYRGLFTTQTLQITKQLRLEAGIRYQQIKAQSHELASALGIDTRTNRDETPTTGSASLSYEVRRGLLAYATVGRSYRPGGESFRSSAAELDKYLHYNPETSIGLEAGVKTTWYNNRLQLNAAIFRQEFNNYISHSGFVFADTNFDGVVDNNFGITFNGDARSQGVEFGMALSLPHRVVLNLDATYVDARWTKARSPASVTSAFGAPVFNTPGEQVSYITLDGKPLGDTPRLELSYSVDWSKRVHAVEFFTRGLIRYKGSRELLNIANPDIGGYALVDLFAGVRSPEGRWSFSAWAKNALDRNVQTNRSNMAFIGAWPSGYSTAEVALPLELGVTASFNF